MATKPKEPEAPAEPVEEAPPNTSPEVEEEHSLEDRFTALESKLDDFIGSFSAPGGGEGGDGDGEPDGATPSPEPVGNNTNVPGGENTAVGNLQEQIEEGIRKVLSDDEHAKAHAELGKPKERTERKGFGRAIWGP